MKVRYLSDEWIELVGTEVAANNGLQSLGGQHAFGLTQVVTSTPYGEVKYHLQSGNGAVVFSAGDANPEDVRFTQSFDTAVAVATGELNAQEAFINGHIRFNGDHQRLIDAQEIFALLDEVFTSVRERTEYRR
ncbi:MAG: SCP2 sterol-binding domain-containing protein [Ilumatobacteraceae bacterium]